MLLCETALILQCQAPFKEEDIIILNGNEAEVDGLRVRLEARQARLKAEKKAKSEAKRKIKAESRNTEICSEPAVPGPSASSTSTEERPSPVEIVKLPTNSKLVPAAATSSKLTIGKPVAGRKSYIINCFLQLLFTVHFSDIYVLIAGDKRAVTDKMNDPAFKKSRDSYSVASDPKATEVFKSLFTTHKSHEKQTRAHWVTYNPFYN